MNDAHMKEAIRLSIDMMESGQGGPFGAVIVQNDKIIARGYNKVTSTCDPTAHAEVVAIREACQKINHFVLQDCEIYTSCEPCPMCMAAIYWARLKWVYYGNTKADAKAIGFDDEWIYNELAKPHGQRRIPMTPCLHQEAQEAFVKWQQKTDKVLY